jgi:methionyl-tRNA synthetase
MEALALHEGAAAAFQLVDAANEYIAEQAPWTLARDPASAGRLDEVLFDVAEAIRIAALLLVPVMPSSSAEILRRVGETRPVRDLRLERDAAWRSDGVRHITKGPALWPRVEESAEETVEEAVEETVEETNQVRQTPPEPKATQAAGAGTTAAEASPSGNHQISIDDFMNVELRVARVLEAEAVPKSKKLVKLRIDVGTEQRTIVAGIAEAYTPDELVGRTIAVVFNLKPAKLMGIESNGMVLAASPEGGKPTLVAFESEVPPGTRVR